MAGMLKGSFIVPEATNSERSNTGRTHVNITTKMLLTVLEERDALSVLSLSHSPVSRSCLSADPSVLPIVFESTVSKRLSFCGGSLVSWSRKTPAPMARSISNSEGFGAGGGFRLGSFG